MLHDIRWTSKKIENRIDFIKSHIYQHRFPIPPYRYRYLEGPTEPPPVEIDVDDSKWEVIQPFDYWANPRTNFILRTTFRVPDMLLMSGQVALYLPIGIAGDFSHPEALVYIDGEPFAACDRHHQEIILLPKYYDGDSHYLALHGWTGIGGSTIGDMTNRLKMNRCEVVLIHQPTRDFIVKARIAHGIALQLEERNPAKHHILTALDNAFQSLDIRVPIGENFYASVPEAKEILQEGLSTAGPALPVNITAIGHAHLDVAWLWTLGQTRHKASRTFHNVLRLMEQFPEHIFAQSQPQLYEYIRVDFPALFESIKKQVAAGRWEVIGGMWVEADCNLTGPESLVRQFLLGRRFFQEHFGEGVESPVLWLPDVFGYAWNLPQLIKEAGLEFFFTIKIGWSQYNRLPYDSFWWQGLDGTKVLTHFSTTKEPDSSFAATYNSDASPGQILGTWLNFQQKDYGTDGEVPPLLMSYGYGDGGGGPTRKMLENIREMKDFPATPKVSPGKVADFFTKLKKTSDNLPIWNGELYLEYHRGTYTTQARNKRANRKSEFLLHDAEFLATYASLLDSNYEYPQDDLNKAWKLVCLNQFHDIIPGSSIAQVYEESLQQYDDVRKIVERCRDEALNVLATALGNQSILVNPTSFYQREILTIEGNQETVGGLLPYSVQTVASSKSQQQPATIEVTPSLLENQYLRVELNDNGDITRILDKVAEREVLPEGAIANQFLAFEDIPLSWDAWDIDIYYDDKVWLSEPATSVEVKENGPYQGILEIKRRILNSDYIQFITISHNSRRLDFDTHINWQERQILLKVAFPVEVLSPMATYEIQWGNVERPTHRNTSWDWARFETAAQKWVDLSEGDYGVSLINDCKYGHDIRENVIRLTLLRGTTAPDPLADLGEHTFKYSIYPHAGNWGMDTVREAYAINDPFILHKSDLPIEDDVSTNKHLPSLLTVNKNNVVIETIKRAEDNNGIIVRLYEYQRSRCRFILKPSFPIKAVWRSNIIEEDIEEIPFISNEIHYSITPYQILTLRVIPANDER